MVPHEREECGWAVVECTYQCGAHLPRRQMDEHQRDECPQQPVDVKLESFMKRMEERHEREMKKMEARLLTEREHYEKELVAMKREMSEQKEIREMEDIYNYKHRSEIIALKSEMTESDKRHELELAKQRKETEIKMAELKVTIIR